MLSQSQLSLLVNDIVSGYQPERIYMFGSYANGTPDKDSDLDLLVIKSTQLRRKDRVEEILNSIKTYPDVGVDFIIYTPQELESVKHDVVNIAKEAIKTGKLLYERI